MIAAAASDLARGHSFFLSADDLRQLTTGAPRDKGDFFYQDDNRRENEFFVKILARHLFVHNHEWLLQAFGLAIMIFCS
jgi:hypothetical protein